MLDWLRHRVANGFLRNPLGDRIRRGGGFTRIGDLLDRFVTSESKQIRRRRQLRALDDTVSFIESQMAGVPSHGSAFTVLAEGVRRASAVSGLYLEFGVREGYTIGTIARLAPARVYGFDSFEGLPEDWTSDHRRGSFAVGRLPRVPGNVSLVRGLFEQSL